MKILQLNKNNSDLHQRVNQINNILTQHKPQLLILNELNLHYRDKITPNLFPKYKLIVDNLRELDGQARTGILIHRDVNYTRRKDLETGGTSTIWVHITSRGNPPLLVQACYRQFQRQNTPDTKSIQHQKARWKSILDKWEVALEEGIEILTMGDLNLDKNSWDKRPEDRNPYENAKQPLIDQLHDRILSKGMYVINNQPTWNLDNPSQKSSILDLILTNRKDRIIDHDTIFPTFSDHAMMCVRRQVSKNQPKTKYMFTRNYG